MAMAMVGPLEFAAKMGNSVSCLLSSVSFLTVGVGLGAELIGDGETCHCLTKLMV